MTSRFRLVQRNHCSGSADAGCYSYEAEWCFAGPCWVSAFHSFRSEMRGGDMASLPTRHYSWHWFLVRFQDRLPLRLVWRNWTCLWRAQSFPLVPWGNSGCAAVLCRRRWNVSGAGWSEFSSADLEVSDLGLEDARLVSCFRGPLWPFLGSKKTNKKKMLQEVSVTFLLFAVTCTPFFFFFKKMKPCINWVFLSTVPVFENLTFFFFCLLVFPKNFFSPFCTRACR